MPSESEFMLGIAAAVADGTAIDWSRAEARLTTDEERRVLRSLRLLSEIGTVHDSVDVEADGHLQTLSGGDDSGDALPRPAEAPGRWGRYELREQLGAGGQGTVYRAWDPQLECEVALKVLQPRLAATDRDGERMLREGRVLAKVRHQNVVNVYAAEMHEGQVGLCMEFIRGRTLEEVLRAQGPFSEDEAIAAGLKVGHALSAVHAAGLVHRDIKARNVMREDRGRIVLMDFGTGRDHDQLARAGAGDLAGTPLYMAPEVLAGASASRQSDVYSMGVLLYYLVTGTHPVEGRTLDEIIQAHVRGRRTPLAERRSDLRNEFIRIVDRALAPDPDVRYESPGMLVHDLVSLDAEEARRTQPPRTVTQRVLLGAAWAAMAAVAITLLGFVASMAFNVALERMAVAGETPKSWFIWGLRSLIAPVANLAQAVIEVIVVVALWRLARSFIPAFDRASKRLVTQTSRLARRAGLFDVDTFGQTAFIIAVVYLVAVVLLHSTLISAMIATVSNITADQRLQLSPVNRVAHARYRSLFDILVLFAAFASFRLARMRRRQPTAISAALLTAMLGVLALSAIMWAAPYRLLYQSARNVVYLDAQRCYDLGHQPAATLVYCPDGPQPRVRGVPDGDPRLIDGHYTESVFTVR
jgi:hypothetical protein